MNSLKTYDSINTRVEFITTMEVHRARFSRKSESVPNSVPRDRISLGVPPHTSVKILVYYSVLQSKKAEGIAADPFKCAEEVDLLNAEHVSVCSTAYYSLTLCWNATPLFKFKFSGFEHIFAASFVLVLGDAHFFYQVYAHKLSS